MSENNIETVPDGSSPIRLHPRRRDPFDAWGAAPHDRGGASGGQQRCAAPCSPPYDREVARGTTEAVQDIRFARSADGTGIAYAVHGSGPPLLIDACWLSHLQFDWQSPVWRHYLRELGRIATVIRYDERGHGLSDRGVTDHSLEARVADLEAVADDARLDRFALLAMAQGGPVAIEYAARHPERLSRLIFYGSYAGAQAIATPVR